MANNVDNEGSTESSAAKVHHVFINVPGLAQAFLDLCLEEVTKGGYQGSSLKPISWKRVRDTLNDKFKLNLEQKALKNKWDAQKKKYVAWRNCVGKSGGGINFALGSINWPEKVWDDVFQANAILHNLGTWLQIIYKNKPLSNAEELYKLFEGTLAMGDAAYATGEVGLPDDHVVIDDDDSNMVNDDTIPIPVPDVEVTDCYWDNVHINTPPVSAQPSTPHFEQGGTSSGASDGSKKEDLMVCKS
ncbi:hypothetical protein IFM89_006757 [Coptis chinensis]|uniref:Myb/SANT-like domain-containing protein n=1 Tax=Coptis chinensis TaxID=261450 RepID=A0A835HP76_9MAGN|nr:hypothetical protein IFM89_006757 [Coptis chinensis]